MTTVRGRNKAKTSNFFGGRIEGMDWNQVVRKTSPPFLFKILIDFNFFNQKVDREMGLLLANLTSQMPAARRD